MQKLKKTFSFIAILSAFFYLLWNIKEDQVQKEPSIFQLRISFEWWEYILMYTIMVSPLIFSIVSLLWNSNIYKKISFFATLISGLITVIILTWISIDRIKEVFYPRKLTFIENSIDLLFRHTPRKKAELSTQDILMLIGNFLFLLQLALFIILYFKSKNQMNTQRAIPDQTAN
jgi:hypothetical protein